MNTLEISKKLFERYESQHRVYHYYGLLALYGFAQTAYESKDEAALDKCKQMLGLYPNKIDHPHYNFVNYEVGGNGKAWLAYKGLLNEELDNIKTYAELTINAPVDSNGILCMPSCPEKEQIWIDVVTAVTPFMLYAGLALNEEKYIDFAAEQCFKMYDILLDKTCGLLHQAKGFMNNPDFVSHDHWSRGNGWGYIGLTELVAYLPKESKHRAKAEKYFVDLSKSLIEYQTDKGVWRQEITSEYSWDESSGTGLITYGLGVGLRTGCLDNSTFRQPFVKAIHGIINFFINDDYSTNMCCCSCLCPGNGKNNGTIKAYLTEVWPCKDDPHSYGSLMLALVEAFRNGMVEVNI